MEVTNSPTTGKFSWTYGLIMGIIFVLFSLVLYSLNLHYDQGWEVNLFLGVVMLASIIIGIWQYKKANGGFLNIREGIKLSVGITVVGVLFLLCWGLLLSKVIEPDYIDKVAAIQKVKVLAINPELTEEQWKQEIEFKKSFRMYPLILMAWTLVALIIGAITGAIMAKRNPNEN